MRSCKAAVVALFVALPLFAAGRPIAEPPLAPTPYGAAAPKTAFAGGRFLTVWREHMQGMGIPIKGAFSDAAGRRISPASFTILPDAMFEWAQLVGMDDGYAFFWREKEITRMASIDLQGRVTRTRVVDVPPFSGSVAAVAWNDSRFLVAVSPIDGFPRNAHALLLDSSGDIVKHHIAIDPRSFAFVVVPTADGFIVVSAGAEVYAHRVGSDGAVEQTLIDATSPGTYPMTIAAAQLANGDILAVWTPSPHSYGPLRSAVLGRDGDVKGSHVIASGIVSPIGLLPNETRRRAKGPAAARRSR